MRPAPALLMVGGGMRKGRCHDPEVEPEDGGVPVPAGGVPVWEPEPLPMLGQLCVELEPEPELELEPEELLEDPELVLPVPEFPDLVPDAGVVVDAVPVELGPELPVVVEVVAALATSAPPARRPEVSAPIASTLRRRICMGECTFRLVKRQPIRAGTPHRAPRIWVRAQNDVGAPEELPDEQVTIHRNRRVRCLRPARGSGDARSACRPGSSAGSSAGPG